MVIFRSYVTIYQRVLNVSVENSDSLHETRKTTNQQTGKEGDSTGLRQIRQVGDAGDAVAMKRSVKPSRIGHFSP